MAPSGDRTIRIQSEGFPMDVVDLDDLSVREEERNTSAAIIRGIAAWFAQHGCEIQGFNAYTTSNVLKGSGLSSSAAFEVLVGNIINSLFNEDKCDAVRLAQIGQYAENVYFGKPSGLLDQMASSVGGMVTIDFQDNTNPIVERVDYDFAASGHALCIIDSGADHADLTDEYAAVTRELKEVCAHFGKDVLREIPEEDFYAALPALRLKAGDRAVLRAIHVYNDNKRVAGQVNALRKGDFDTFLALISESGSPAGGCSRCGACRLYPTRRWQWHLPCVSGCWADGEPAGSTAVALPEPSRLLCLWICWSSSAPVWTGCWVPGPAMC